MASSTTKTTLFLDLLWWMLMKLAKETTNQIFCVSVCLLKHSSLLENYHSLAVLAWLCCFRKVRKKNIISLIPGYLTKYRNSSNKIYSKYEDLLVQTICTFELKMSIIPI